MFKKFFDKVFLNSHVSSSVSNAAFFITFFGLASRLLGLFRDRLLAATFGAGDILDIYYAAFRIPDLIYNFLILGALSAAFIPVFTELISGKKEKKAWRLSAGIMDLAITFIVIFSLFLCFMAPYLMKLITPGFSPEKISQVVIFTRIMFFSPLFLGIGGIFGATLTSYKRFVVFSLAPIFYNLGIIFGILVLVKFCGPIGLAWGVVLGAFLHMLVQYPAVKSLGFNFKKDFFSHIKNVEVIKVLKLMIPRVFGIAANQINLFAITIFASILASGSLAIFNFAQNLQSVPLGIFGVSFSIAAFPMLSSFFAQKNNRQFVKTFSQTFRQILFFVIPISVFIILLRAQIVRVVLGTGKFDWEDTTLTFQCLGIFSVSLFAQSFIPLLARSFYAMQNTKIPFYVALAGEITNISTILILLILIGKQEILSLAIAFSLSSIVQMFLLLFLLRLRFENLDDKKILESITKISLAAFLGGLIIQFFKYLTAILVNMDTFFGVFIQLGVASFFGGITFLFMCYLLKTDEFFSFKKSFTKRIFPNKEMVLPEDINNDLSGF